MKNYKAGYWINLDANNPKPINQQRKRKMSEKSIMFTWVLSEECKDDMPLEF